MEHISLDATSVLDIRQHFQLTGSKSESNRMLILKAFHPEIQLTNLSNADDTQLLQEALLSEAEIIDINHAGTAMRFLTSYFAFNKGRDVLLTGSKRMKERPIGILVDALRSLGADIQYEANEGFPPLRIKGVSPSSNQVTIQAGMSSQYVSSILLATSYFSEGLQVHLEGEITSLPYLQMTIDLMQKMGYEVRQHSSSIKAKAPFQLVTNQVAIESDWSSASYFFSLLALSKEGKISLSNFRHNSLQGDSQIVNYFELLGVSTQFKENNTLVLSKKKVEVTTLELDLNATPDVAQTLCVACLGLGINAHFTGLHTLKIKETDRLQALKNELEKFGAIVEITNSTLRMISPKLLSQNNKVVTYNDHRMAMAFAPLALKVPFSIKDPMVVIKSFPDFWEQLKFLIA